MSDVVSELGRACEALRQGRIAEGEALASAALAVMRENPPCAEDIPAIRDQLGRLGALARAAQEGIGAATQLLRDLAATAGGLDHYTREGRRRIDTRVGRETHRF